MRNKRDYDFDRFISLSEITPEGMKILREKYHKDPVKLISRGLSAEDAFLWERNHFDTHKEEMPQDCEEEREKSYRFGLYQECLRWWDEDEAKRKANPGYDQRIHGLWQKLTNEEKQEFERLDKLFAKNPYEYGWVMASKRLKFFYGFETRDQYLQYKKDHPEEEIIFSTYQPIFKLKSNEELDRERKNKHVKR